MRPRSHGSDEAGWAALDAEEDLRAAYAAHGAELYRAALRALGDSGLAEDAVQETFVRAWRAAGRFDPAIASLRSWLFAILRNVVIDLARARSARPPLAPRNDGEEPSTEGVDQALVAWQVEEALRRLRDDHRHAVIEIQYRRRPYAEVAAELGIPEGTLKSRVFYGLKALRLALEEIGWRDDA